MKYCSTRGGVKGLTFAQAILSGFASDGGILLPESIPRVNSETLRHWSTLSYVGLFKEVLPLFISEEELSRQIIDDLVDDSFRQFDCPDVIQLVEPFDQQGVFVAELWHGQTGAFKDIALGVLGQCIERVLEKQQQRLTILVGTSGDTGSAAIHSVRSSKYANIIVLYPHLRITEIQRRQMTTAKGKNVKVFAVDGTSDDLDVPIKKAFTDDALVQKYHLCSINSINVGRVLFQCVHFLYSFFRACSGDLTKRVQIFVPTGAGGNLCGGLIARQLTGLEFQFVVCVNENDILHRWLTTGRFCPVENVVPTSSSAMDIQSPYNIDRLLYFLSGGDSSLVQKLMEQFEESKSFDMPQHLRNEAAKFMLSCRVTESECLAVMKSVWRRHNYLLCPHTAIGVHAALHTDVRDGTTPAVCIATATAHKFPEGIAKAGIIDPPSAPESILKLFEQAEQMTVMRRSDDWELELRQAIASFGE